MERLGSLEHAQPSLAAEPDAGVSSAMMAGAEGDEAVAAVSSKLFRCACLRRWLPLVYREEIYHILRFTGPLVLSRILRFLLTVCNSIFCGQTGNAELAGYALASVTIHGTIASPGFGLSLACDTLISQTFGGKNIKRVGVILQRSLLIMLLFCLPCWAVLINSHSLLLFMYQENAVVRISYLYLMAFLPAVPAMFLHQLQTSYLQSQGIALPQMYAGAAANIINLAVNYVLIFSLELGVIGSAIANSLCQVILCLLLFGYIRRKKLHQETWEGWSADCLQEWGSYMKLAIPSVFMICFEWWIWDIGGFFAGLLGKVDLAAQHVLVELSAITYQFPLGIHEAACVRVGNALGAGNTASAIVTCKVSLVLTGVLSAIQGIIIASCKSNIGYIFTSDDNIVGFASEILTVYAFLQFFDAVQCVCSGILVGAGMQKIAVLSKLVNYYFIGLPAGIALMFAAKLRILGLWLGLLICVFLEVVFFLVVLFKLNWKKVTHKAQLRAGKKMAVIPKRRPSRVLNEAMVPDVSAYTNTEAKLDSEEAPKADGYSPVNTQDQELSPGPEAESHNRNAASTEGEAEQSTNTANTKPQVLLSVTQLILRRGLAIFVTVLILGIGVVLRIAFPPPEPSAQSRANFTLNWTNSSTRTPLVPLDLIPNL